MSRRPNYGDAQTPTFDAALTLARENPKKPQPLCLDRTAEFADYTMAPTPKQAEELCEPCPLLALCKASARKTRPAWGVHGGEHWDMGKRIS